LIALLPSSPVPVVALALLAGLAAARVLRPDLPAPPGSWRSVSGHAVPGIATAAIAVVVWTTPVGTWAPATAGVLGLAAILAPYGSRVRSRAPTPAERAVLRDAPGETGDVRVTEANARGTGHAAADPFTGVVTASADALAALSPRAVAALVAHERAHVERRHALLRASTSASVLAAGTGLAALALPGATAVGIGVFATLAAERLLAGVLARRTEFAADAAAARRTSPGAVVELLASLPDGTERRRLRRLLAAHPAREHRLARVRARSDAPAPRTAPDRRAYAGDGPTDGMDREALAYALLFSVPPAVGMTGFSVMATSGGLINPVAALVGAATFGIIFAFVYVAATRGQADESRSPGTI
jgi:hypothetical protein